MKKNSLQYNSFFFHFSIQILSTLYHINNFLLLLKKKKKSIQRSLPNTTLDSLVTNTLFNLIIRLPKQPKYIYIYRTLRCFQTIKLAYMNPYSRNKRDWHVHCLNMDYSTTDLINNVYNCTWSNFPVLSCNYVSQKNCIFNCSKSLGKQNQIEKQNLQPSQ
jgi:hypothetical protein